MSDATLTGTFLRPAQDATYTGRPKVTIEAALDVDLEDPGDDHAVPTVRFEIRRYPVEPTTPPIATGRGIQDPESLSTYTWSCDLEASGHYLISADVVAINVNSHAKDLSASASREFHVTIG